MTKSPEIIDLDFPLPPGVGITYPDEEKYVSWSFK